MEDLEKENNQTNQDYMQMIDELKSSYENKLAEEKAKTYAAVKHHVDYLRNVGTGEESSEPELSPEEKYDNAKKITQNAERFKNADVAQALLIGDEYLRETTGRSVFCSEEGTLSEKEEKIADKAVAAISYALEKATEVKNGKSYVNPQVFSSVMDSMIQK